MDKIWPGVITQNQVIEYDDLDGYMLYLGTFAPGERVESVVRKERKYSSLPQNRYYWGVIVKIISDYTGHTPDEIHDVLKWKFLVQEDEKHIKYVPSTSDLTTAEREEYHAQCRRWAALVLELNVPMPNEVDYAESEEGQETMDELTGKAPSKNWKTYALGE